MGVPLVMAVAASTASRIWMVRLALAMAARATEVVYVLERRKR